MIEYCSFSAAECGGRVTGQSGVVESNGYPTLPYTDDLFCEWHLQGPSGHYLTIRFEDFNLQDSSGCERDFVEIWENHTSGQWDMSAVFWGYLFSQVTHSASEISSLPSKARLFFFFFFFAEKCRSVSSGQCQLFSPSVLTHETVVSKAPVSFPSSSWGHTERARCAEGVLFQGDLPGPHFDVWGAFCKVRREGVVYPGSTMRWVLAPVAWDHFTNQTSKPPPLCWCPWL